MSEVTFETAVLVRLLKIIKTAIETRGTVAQLGHVTFRATENGATVSATNLDLELTLDIPNARMSGDAFTLPWAELSKFLASADKGALVSVTPFSGSETDAKDLDRLPHRVELDGMSAHLSGFKLQDMPTAIAPDLVPSVVSMSEADLHAALSACRHAISSEETRYYLKGVFMHANELSRGALTFVSTDGHRLAAVTTAQTPSRSLACIIPTSAVTALLAALDARSDYPVIIQWGDRHAAFTGSAFNLSTKLIDGNFPDYTRVLPPSTDCQARLDIPALTKQTGRLKKLGVAALKIDLEAGEISGRDKDKPDQRFSAAIPFAVEGLTAAPFGVSVPYLLDGLAAASDICADVDLIKSTSAVDPFILRPRDAGSFQDVKFVIMPVRV